MEELATILIHEQIRKTSISSSSLSTVKIRSSRRELNINDPKVCLSIFDDLISAEPTPLSGEVSSLDPSSGGCSSDAAAGGVLSGGCYLDPPTDSGESFILEHFKNKYIEPEVNYLVECRLESPSVYVDKQTYSPFARLALEYFNTKEDTNFKLHEVTAIGINLSFPKSLIHINFDGEMGTSGRQLFYAELKSSSIHQIVEIEVEIMGCSLLEVVEPGNPLGIGCGYCETNVVHPGPLDGCRVLAGDKFENSLFWSYGRVKLDPSWIQQKTTKGMEMYNVCAQKAIKHLNHVIHATSLNQVGNDLDKEVRPQKNVFEAGECEWELLRVTAAVDEIRGLKLIIHLNFTVKRKRKAEEQLCFAELALPFFNNDCPRTWDMRKEPFLKVNGCCILESTVERPFGRACDICIDGLAHPGPRYGYEASAGDEFSGYRFKDMGKGVF